MGWASSGAISTASLIFQIRAKTATALHQLEGMQEVVLVVTLGIPGEEDLAVAVALDPEVVGIVGLEDLDVVPLPIREAFQRPHRVLGQLVLATNDDGRTGIGGP